MKYLQRLRWKGTLMHLKWYDILVVTALLFGVYIYHSMSLLFSAAPTSTGQESITSFDFSATTNYYMIFDQGKWLLLAMWYLALRRFDFSQLKIQFRWNVLVWAVLIFVATGIACDLFWDAFHQFGALRYLPYYDWSLDSIARTFGKVPFDLVLYSLFNGFYEEIFFLGLLFCTKIDRKWLYLFSTLVRISFHTYQGWLSAVMIGVVMGTVYYYLYTRKQPNLVPFFLAHAIADMVGVGFLGIFYPVG
ncbi:MAG: CPBP family intramembrane metalloprotease [Aerococcaceae bacterium]|nr:CPBP family intramembrane metalloprotease [Aerococcaceae bacterium]